MPSTVPVNFYVTPFADHGNADPAPWDLAQADEIMVVANHIWNNVGIFFPVKGNRMIDKPLDMAVSARHDEVRILDALSLGRPDTTKASVFLIGKIPDWNVGGSAYPNSKEGIACWVQGCYTDTKSCGRAVAHELGHLLGLGHLVIGPQDKNTKDLAQNLMKPGLTAGGTKLTPAQIKKAQGSDLAKKFVGKP